MNVSCPNCATVYRVDPRKVPEGGVRARCATCAHVFRVAREPVEAVVPSGVSAAAPVPSAPAFESAASPEPATRALESTGNGAFAVTEATYTPTPSAAPPEPSYAPGPATPPTEAPLPAFGAADPHARARRLARALVSDIVVYNTERRDRSLRDGSLRNEFREEIRKSWEEYAAQVGDDFARDTPYFRQALNEILAGGGEVF